MTEALLSKDTLIELAETRAADSFTFLAPVRSYLRQTRNKDCATCGKPAKRVTLPDDLYKAVLRSATFTQEAAGLAGFLRVDRLTLPGMVTQA